MGLLSYIDVYTTIIFAGIFALVYILMGRKQLKSTKIKCLPSLPVLPIVGSMPFMAEHKDLHLFFMKKAKQLGNVFGLRLASFNVVVLNGREIIHEALVKKSLDFASRPYFVLSQKFNKKLSGIIEHVYNAEFRRYHQLSINIFKEFGFGQGVMETRIQVEIDELIKDLRKLNSAAVHPEVEITKSMMNVVASILFGSRFDSSDRDADAVIRITQAFIRDSIDANTANFFPILRHLPYIAKVLDLNIRHQNELFEMFDRKIAQACLDGADESFIKSFIQHEGEDYDRDQLLFLLRDFLFAGTETSSTTIQWALVMLANHPDIQKRLQEEIDATVPRDRLPSLDDHTSLPFVEAAILEVMRWKTIVPLSLPHSTTCDTEVGGYFIPANALVFVNLYSAHMDPTVWTDPELYKPERFLDSAGQVVNKEQMISFSLGRRSCLGELLARQEVYLFFTGLIQQFNILPPEGQARLDVHDNVSVSLTPSHYQVRFVPRE